MEFKVPQNLHTMPEPQRIEGDRVGVPGAFHGLGCWYWILGGRMFVSSWSVSPEHSKETQAAREHTAYRRLLDYVDAVLPPKPKDDSVEAIDGCNLIQEGGVLPTPPAIQPEIDPADAGLTVS